MKKLRPGIARAWQREQARQERQRLATLAGKMFAEIFFRESPLMKRIREKKAFGSYSGS